VVGEIGKIAGRAVLGEVDFARDARLSREQAHEGEGCDRFAGAGLTDQTQNFAGSDREVEIADGRQGSRGDGGLGLSRKEFYVQAADVEEREHDVMLAAAGYWPRINGRPFLLLPITTTFELGLFARFSVASMPFHSSREGVMPWATICWKSRTPAASMRLR
jgi:hypothetical protein